jgi:hypothetical protein
MAKIELIYIDFSSGIKREININTNESLTNSNSYNSSYINIKLKTQDRLMIPKNSNYEQIEWIKKNIILSSRYTLYERDSYLVFFFL